MLLGVDRLDYTKGIPHRLRIFEALLERHPELRGRAHVRAGRRADAHGHRALRRARGEVAELVDADQRALPRGASWLPVRYMPEHHDRDALAPLFRRADACLVTSLHDGMNLVAKEYVAAHAGAPGTLLLSKFTGAARELLEASLVNPYDIEGSADVLAESLHLPESGARRGDDAPVRAHLRARRLRLGARASCAASTTSRAATRRRRFPGN